MKKINLTLRNIYDSSRTHSIGVVTWWYLAIAFAALVAMISIFVNLANEVIDGDTLAVDETILRWFEGFHSPWLDSIVSVMTDAGGTVGVVTIVLVSLGLLLWRRRRSAALQLSFGVVGAVALNIFLKNIISRDRPSLWESVVMETSYSFPSGHAMASSALAFSLILIFWHTRYRILVCGLATLYVVFVGATRLYLGVHYPSDIVAGWTMSGIWVLIVAVLIGTLRVRKSS